MSRSRTAVSAVSALLAAAASTAVGGVPLDLCNPALPYTMPDHDQSRAAGVGVLGLANNGVMYCVPTCTMDILTYLQNHGYPNLSAGPGPGPWLGSLAIYNAFTTDLSNLGVLMGTDPMGGTGGNDALAGVRDWIEITGYKDDIVVSTMGMTGSNAPELGDIAFGMIARIPMSLSVGWYTTLPNGNVQRSGGHCVAVTRLPNFCGVSRQLTIRDPGNSIGSNNTSQGAGTSETYVIQTQNITRVSVDDATQVVYSGPAERIVGYGTRGIIDGFRAFTPVWGLAACNNPVNGSCVTQRLPSPTFTGLSPTTQGAFDPQATVLDLDFRADNLGGWVLARGPGQQVDIHLWSLGNPQPSRVNITGLGAFSPTALCSGPDARTVFALASNPQILLKINTATGQITPTSLPDPAAAICLDTRTNEVVVFSAANRRVSRFDPYTLAPLGTRNLPATVVIGPTPRIAVCPVGSYLWLTSGVNTGYGLLGGTGPALNVAATISGGQPLVGVDATAGGNVVTTSGGDTVEFTSQGPTVLAWARIAGGSKWDGLANGPVFRIAKNRSNLQAIHDSPEETLNVLPTSFARSEADCRADFDRSGELDVADIFAFLSAWFAGGITADFNEDNQRDVTDIFAMLSAWFAGCPD